ncbi:MAG: right-handed parallel beta-helix repeat-containing protein [Sphingopyxis sp.]
MMAFAGTSEVASTTNALTPSMFGVPDDGDESQDVTAALLALAAAAAEQKLPVRLGPRTYRTDGTTIPFPASVSGTGTGNRDTLIQSTTKEAAGPLVRITGPGTVENLRIDGNASADPATWTARNHDSFTGSQGILITARNVVVRNIVVQNVRMAGFKVESGSRQIHFEDCRAVRCRGVFGDGFITLWAQEISYTRCRAYDFTRIGFVADTYGEPGSYCSQISYEDCHAEYGHHASLLYGGGEYNSGWWSEYSHEVTYRNCVAINMTHRGFTAASGIRPPTLSPGAAPTFQFDNCQCRDTHNGFIVNGYKGVPIEATLQDCVADINDESAFNVSSLPGDRVHLINCRSYLRGTRHLRVSLRVGSGETIVDGFTEIWETRNTQYGDEPEKYYGSVGHFENEPGRVILRDWKSTDSHGTPVGTIYKFLWGARNTLDLVVERGFVRGSYMTCKNFTATDIEFETIRSIRASGKILIKGGSIRGGGPQPAFIVDKTTQNISLEDVSIDFRSSHGQLYFYNASSNIPKTKIAMNRCTIKKDFASDGPAIRIGGADPVINLADCNNILVTNCQFTNSGGPSRNPIFLFDGSNTAAGRVKGRGNKKSRSLLNVTIVPGRKAVDAVFSNLG